MLERTRASLPERGGGEPAAAPGASEQRHLPGPLLHSGPGARTEGGTCPNSRTQVARLPGRDTANRLLGPTRAVVFRPIIFPVKHFSLFSNQLISGPTTNPEQNLKQNKVQ